MATSLIQRPGSPFFYVAFDVRQPDGTIKRLKKSTKKKTREEAMAEVSNIVDAERKLAIATDEQNKQNLQILAQGIRAAAKGELTEVRVREMLSRILETSTGQGLQSYTARTWSEEWFRRKAPLAKSTKARYSTSVRAFLSFLGTKADSRLEAITKADIRRFREVIQFGRPIPAVSPKEKSERKHEEIAPIRTAKTANQYTADITGMLQEAVSDELLTANPAAGLRRLDETDSEGRKPFSNKEVKILFGKAGDSDWQSLIFSPKTSKPRLRLMRHEDWPGMVLFGYYVGTRLGDIARLTWDNIDLKTGIARFRPAKTKAKLKYYEVPLHPHLLSWLQSRNVKKEPDEPIFPTLFKTTPAGKVGLSSQFSKIMEFAEIDRCMLRVAKNGIRAQYARGFHSLRHTSNSALANAGVSPELRMKIIGHQSQEVNRGYTHHELEIVRDAINKVPAI